MFVSIGQSIQINRHGFIFLGILIVATMLVLYKFTFYNKTKQSLRSEKFNQFIDLQDLLSASIDAAKRGGCKVYEIRESAFLQEKSKGKTAEGANDPVTDGDMQSHIEMYHSLKNAFPELTIISEEKPSHKIDGLEVLPANVNIKEIEKLIAPSWEPVNIEDIRVWIDPLDATQEYTENLRQYVTTMVCVAVKGVPTIGVIHKPFENFTAWAWVGRGHSPNLQVKKEKEGGPSSPVKVIVSRSHKGPVVTKAQEAFGKDVKVTAAGGAGYKVLEVLSGGQDVYFHSTLIKKWDICAGNAILSHFNGRMTTIDGFDINYNSASEYKNPDGLVASLNNHDFYLQKLNSR